LALLIITPNSRFLTCRLAQSHPMQAIT